MNTQRESTVVLATDGLQFQHHGLRFAVPSFVLRTGAALGLALPQAALSDLPDILPDEDEPRGADATAVDDLAETLLGLAPLAAGRVSLFGHELGRIGRSAALRLRRRVALAPLRPAFLSTVTVPDNIAIPLRDRRDPSDRELHTAVHERLAALGVPIVGRVLPGELTPRGRYLAGLARASLTEPELLIICRPEARFPRGVADVVAHLLEHQVTRGGALLLLGTERALHGAAVAELMRVERSTAPAVRGESA